MLARIIKSLRDNGPSSRTPLATACGLSYDRFVKYLEWITAKGFVTIDENGLVHLTPAGSKAYDELVQWILDHVGSLRPLKPPSHE